MPNAIAARRFVPTADMRRLAEADAVLICVPTPLSESRDPDLSYIEATARQIAAVLRPGQLIVLESTTYPGTTRDVVLPILADRRIESRRRIFSWPIAPNAKTRATRITRPAAFPKWSAASSRTALDWPRRSMGMRWCGSCRSPNCEVAEACKILENTYRSVNIAMVNELKMLFDRMGIDVWEVIDAAKTKPFGFQAFYPGPGLGGHCIPIDPFYLSWVARKHGMITRFIELAGEINTSMPQYVVQRLVEALNDIGKPLRGSKICLLGIAYKKDVDDPRESPSFELMEMLMARGAEVTLQRSARAALAAHAASSGFASMASQPLDAGLFGGPGLRADRHRPLGLRLRFHRPPLAA